MKISKMEKGIQWQVDWLMNHLKEEREHNNSKDIVIYYDENSKYPCKKH